MPVTNTAAFGQVPILGQAILTAAKAAPLSGTSNTALLMTAGANGSIVHGIAAIPRDTLSSAAHIAVYCSPDAGTTLNLVAIGLLAAWTFSATSSPTPLNLSNLNGAVIAVTNPLYIPPTNRLYASSSQALTNGVMVSANGVDL
jgi:hypothetical protein